MQSLSKASSILTIQGIDYHSVTITCTSPVAYPPNPTQALKGNAKIAHYPSPEEDLFLFRPALGLDVRSRKQLLEKLMDYERKGLGGVLMSEVKEALHNPEKAVKVSRLGNKFCKDCCTQMI